ncbi:RNA polymerase sigma factor [Alkalitalea saponilacus]|uniref:RNA polymerase sigma-70 factor, ECF subfamily n=1 Tax=Alkalitalea saponilacus TaxID=889453 RepID=A0A1T5CMD5_9BACT|nr:RNA polymerase sigma factor [Alkalitalea saponilacus]ASB49920.1 RNA polymerase subunit sigma-70 [Alkalitalea saponilacus]SKB60655.1 RNA polymerase sigma-70 factor, ECF subfamily [Alkalitalea saponilacus]
MSRLNEIIPACRNGDRKAQKELYELFAPKMFAVCIRYSKNRVEAEDYLHEGFIKIFEKIDQYGNKGSFEGWVRRIMVNTILEGYRKNKQMVVLDESQLKDENADDEADEPTDEEASVKLEEVMTIIEQLPEKYSLVFNLYVLEDYSHEEISNKLGISIGTSKSNLSRARQWIKKRLCEEKKTASVNELWQN